MLMSMMPPEVYQLFECNLTHTIRSCGCATEENEEQKMREPTAAASTTLGASTAASTEMPVPRSRARGGRERGSRGGGRGRATSPTSLQSSAPSRLFADGAIVNSSMNVVASAANTTLRMLTPQQMRHLDIFLDHFAFAEAAMDAYERSEQQHDATLHHGDHFFSSGAEGGAGHGNASGGGVGGTPTGLFLNEDEDIHSDEETWLIEQMLAADSAAKEGEGHTS